MAVIFNVVLPILAGVSILAMFYFIWRAFSGRYKAARQPYNVGRQEARQLAQVNLVRAVFALIMALIFLGVIGVSSQLAESLPAATATPVQRTRPPTSEATTVPTATKTTVTSEPSPTSPPPTSSATPLSTATNTPEPFCRCPAFEATKNAAPNGNVTYYIITGNWFLNFFEFKNIWCSVLSTYNCIHRRVCFSGIHFFFSIHFFSFFYDIVELN